MGSLETDRPVRDRHFDRATHGSGAASDRILLPAAVNISPRISGIVQDTTHARTVRSNSAATARPRVYSSSPSIVRNSCAQFRFCQETTKIPTRSIRTPRITSSTVAPMLSDTTPARVSALAACRSSTVKPMAAPTCIDDLRGASFTRVAVSCAARPERGERELAIK